MMGRRQSAIAEGVLITSPSPSTISGRPAMALPWRGGPRGWTGRSMCPAIAIQKRIARQGIWKRMRVYIRLQTRWSAGSADAAKLCLD